MAYLLYVACYLPARRMVIKTVTLHYLSPKLTNRLPLHTIPGISVWCRPGGGGKLVGGGGTSACGKMNPIWPSSLILPSVPWSLCLAFACTIKCMAITWPRTTWPLCPYLCPCVLAMPVISHFKTGQFGGSWNVCVNFLIYYYGIS